MRHILLTRFIHGLKWWGSFGLENPLALVGKAQPITEPTRWTQEIYPPPPPPNTHTRTHRGTHLLDPPGISRATCSSASLPRQLPRLTPRAGLAGCAWQTRQRFSEEAKHVIHNVTWFQVRRTRGQVEPALRTWQQDSRVPFRRPHQTNAGPGNCPRSPSTRAFPCGSQVCKKENKNS